MKINNTPMSVSYQTFVVWYYGVTWEYFDNNYSDTKEVDEAYDDYWENPKNYPTYEEFMEVRRKVYEEDEAYNW